MKQHAGAQYTQPVQNIARVIMCMATRMLSSIVLPQGSTAQHTTHNRNRINITRNVIMLPAPARCSAESRRPTPLTSTSRHLLREDDSTGASSFFPLFFVVPAGVRRRMAFQVPAPSPWRKATSALSRGCVRSMSELLHVMLASVCSSAHTTTVKRHLACALSDLALSNTACFA